jgi:hypothetical protein
MVELIVLKIKKRLNTRCDIGLTDFDGICNLISSTIGMFSSVTIFVAGFNLS